MLYLFFEKKKYSLQWVLPGGALFDAQTLFMFYDNIWVLFSHILRKTIFFSKMHLSLKAFPVLFFNKQFAASRHVLYYLLSNVCLPQMFLSISTVHFYRSSFLFRVMSYYTCLIIFYFCLTTTLMYKIHFFALLLILFT